jgi:hypothetical protein
MPLSLTFMASAFSEIEPIKNKYPEIAPILTIPSTILVGSFRTFTKSPVFQLIHKDKSSYAYYNKINVDLNIILFLSLFYLICQFNL